MGASPRSESLAHLLVCGTRLGHLLLYRLNSGGGDHDGTLLSFRLPPLQSLSLALGPIDSVTVHANGHDSRGRGGESAHLLYVRCGANTVILELCGGCFTRQFFLPDTHTNLVTSIVPLCPLDGTPATVEHACQGASLLTSSMDGQVILCSRENGEDISGSVPRHSRNQAISSLPSPAPQGYPATSPATHIPARQLTPIKYLTFSNDANGNNRSVSSSSKDFTDASRLLPVIDVTVDSSQCMMASAHVTPRVMSRDRETQMNPKRLRTNVEVVFELLPSLDPLWAFDADLIIPVMRRAVSAYQRTAHVPTTNLGFAGDENDVVPHSSFSGGCTWLGGVTLAWLQSVEKYVEQYVEDGKLVLARQPTAPPNDSSAKIGEGRSSSSAAGTGADTGEPTQVDSIGESSALTSMQDATEPDDDLVKVGCGIMGVALRCRELLYPPSMKAVVLQSVEKVLVAATVVAQELDSAHGGSHTGANETLLDFPSDHIHLQSKMRLWQLVHNLLVASSSSSAAAYTSFDRPPHIAECVRALRSRLRVAHAALAAKRFVVSVSLPSIATDLTLITPIHLFYHMICTPNTGRSRSTAHRRLLHCHLQGNSSRCGCCTTTSRRCPGRRRLTGTLPRWHSSSPRHHAPQQSRAMSRSAVYARNR